MRKWPEGSITLLIEKGFRSSKLKAKDELVTLSLIFLNTAYIFFLLIGMYLHSISSQFTFLLKKEKKE